MTGLGLCFAAFIITYFFTTRRKINGIKSALTFGFFYGILRANFLDSFTHFIFDAAALGLYLGFLPHFLTPLNHPNTRDLQRWTLILIIWPCLIACIPIQHYAIQLVGLRGNAFLIPFLIVGAWINTNDAKELGIWLALLCLITFGFAIAEFVLGVPTFYPYNSVTDIIYRSRDAGSDQSFRIPATFINAHAFAGNMVLSLPWIVGALLQSNSSQARIILLAGAGCAVMGVMLASTRLWFVQLALVLVLTSFSGVLRGGLAFGWLIILIGIGYFVSGEERTQRFITIFDAEMLANRVVGSVNLSFLELATEYPMGNGMGGGGTSIPFFLQEYLTNPIGLENEYSRIMLEQGIPGLMLWVSFALWIVTRPFSRLDTWYQPHRLIWWLTSIGFTLGLLGTGMLTAIPQTSLSLLSIGFMLSSQPRRPGIN